MTFRKPIALEENEKMMSIELLEEKKSIQKRIDPFSDSSDELKEEINVFNKKWIENGGMVGNTLSVRR